MDRPGGSYSSFDLSSPSPILCQQACAVDPKCQSFTYVKPDVQGTNARCWLKNSVPSAKEDSCCVSGVKNDQQSGSQSISLEYNTDRPGGSYNSFDLSSPSPILCQQACSADLKCQAFSYVNPGIQGPNARCWLKNSVSAPVSSSCCVSGVKNSSTGASSPSITIDYSNIPGLILHLWHNENQDDPYLDSTRSDVIFLHGGDLGGQEGVGYSWWMISDDPYADPFDWNKQLPPGLVLGLRHSSNQRDDNRITAFGNNPVNGPADFGRSQNGDIIREDGGDRDGSEGEGYYWYETNNQHFQEWDFAEQNLPKGTILGLKHSMNQPDKTVTWRGLEYDPVKCFKDASAFQSPPTFAPRNGGDLGSPSGEGYYWFEKTNGPEFFKAGPPHGPIIGST